LGVRKIPYQTHHREPISQFQSPHQSTETTKPATKQTIISLPPSPAKQIENQNHNPKPVPSYPPAPKPYPSSSITTNSVTNLTKQSPPAAPDHLATIQTGVNPQTPLLEFQTVDPLPRTQARRCEPSCRRRSSQAAAISSHLHAVCDAAVDLFTDGLVPPLPVLRKRKEEVARRREGRLGRKQKKKERKHRGQEEETEKIKRKNQEKEEIVGETEEKTGSKGGCGPKKKKTKKKKWAGLGRN
jgi:hypothetical protein